MSKRNERIDTETAWAVRADEEVGGILAAWGGAGYLEEPVRELMLKAYLQGKDAGITAACNDMTASIAAKALPPGPGTRVMVPLSSAPASLPRRFWRWS
ncbi:hypothetical protein UFOVP411_42 [uncultured Caudovirales phage]|uniref:Uncharacterized protein n=1 Tax=uncultured Caudovirales phage TaxID=2100421 RepID=A0A6J5M6I4_9CAUD|nr:hypothetical protein UFOVP411_42 [uncultured Caudovirales phage]